MSEAGRSLLQERPRTRRLADAIRDVKNIAADRADVIDDLRETSRTRLELLAQELEPVFAEVPADDPSFDFAISSGEHPRLWIDAVAHVAMARDQRTYRFVRDTRSGRVVMAETAELKGVVDQVTLYIAERMVERQRMIDGDVDALPRGSHVDTADGEPGSAPAARSGNGFWTGVLCLVLGALVGVGALLLLYPERFPEALQFLQSLA
jgi:hypothetical protein